MGRDSRVSKLDQKASDAIYRQALEIIDAEWRAAGVSEEESRLDERLAEAFARKVASGQDVDELLARWRTLTPEQILKEADTAEQGGQDTTFGDGSVRHASDRGIQPRSRELDPDPVT
jgi:hypothetical protein